ncbi:MAG: CCA tRNA nucleotidyltransferase [Actinomycetota bacterium]|nr:CCA tRNA nucleotidyltransferase [Actinomycetota bacterium]
MAAPELVLEEIFADDSSVLRLAARFRERGHELYLVGGPVRDLFLKRPHVDLDLATDATPETTLQIIEPISTAQWLQGMRFGTVGASIDGVRMEITTFRSERYDHDSRHPQVDYEKDIESDLSRRDFTINAMAIRLPEKEATDPFGGMDDLKARIIRTPIDPDASFTDDPLRMLRAFRFASQLDFDIDAETLRSITRLKDQLHTVSAERIAEELTKLLLGEKPGRALELADSTGITDIFLPELSALKLEQDPVHRHKDVFHHTLAVVEKTEPILELRLAALLHDIGKPKTRRIDAEGVSFHHHEIEGAKMAEKRLRALRYPNEVVTAVRDLIKLHHRFHTYRLGWTDSAVRRYVRDAGPLLGTLNDLVRADCTTRNTAKAKRLAARMDELVARIQELAAREELEKLRPELDGDQIMAYLGIRPSPEVGRARDFLMELRLDEGLLGEDEAYRRLDRWARANGIEPVGIKIPPKKHNKNR